MLFLLFLVLNLIKSRPNQHLSRNIYSNLLCRSLHNRQYFLLCRANKLLSRCPGTELFVYLNPMHSISQPAIEFVHRLPAKPLSGISRRKSQRFFRFQLNRSYLIRQLNATRKSKGQALVYLRQNP